MSLAHTFWGWEPRIEATPAKIVKQPRLESQRLTVSGLSSSSRKVYGDGSGSFTDLHTAGIDLSFKSRENAGCKIGRLRPAGGRPLLISVES
jgi:hypothetical protein